MIVKLNIPDYDGEGLDVIWNENAKYTVGVEEQSYIIRANREALISFAEQMLYMAYHDLPMGSHVHYDEFFTKIKSGKYELVIEKIR